MRYVLLAATVVLAFSCGGQKRCEGAACGSDGGPNGQDGGGVDAGPLDLGPQPDADGGGALNLVAVADENAFALAWSNVQQGSVATWRLYSAPTPGVPSDVQLVAGDEQFVTVDAGSSVTRDFWVYGLNGDGGVVFGSPFTSAGADGGAGCNFNADCPIDQVCDLGVCKRQSCTNSGTCPVGYICENVTSFLCYRTNNLQDAGNPQGNELDGGSTPRPFISERRTATTGAPSFHEAPISPVADQDPDIVGIDSARQVVTLQENGQLYVHVTEDRGATWRVSAVDPLGQHARVTYNPASKRIFVCYAAGETVRVRSSADLGRTWSFNVATIANPDPGDGGVAPAVSDCDIAPWQNGGAIVVVSQTGALNVYTVDSNLTLAGPDVAFADESTTGTGTVFNAREPVIASLPSESIVHVGFTGTHNTSGTGTDNDVYDVYRDPLRTGGTFSTRARVSTGGSPTASGQPLDQTHLSLALLPGTGRAVGAFTSDESLTTGGIYKTVYVSLFAENAQSQWGWASGPDLSVFEKNATNGSYYVVTDRQAGTQVWDAINGSVSVQGNGRIFVAFAAGVQGPTLYPYGVFFDFNATSPLGGKGWFVPPAVKLSSSPVVNFTNTPKGSGPIATGDAQLSSYVTFIEGGGGNSDVPLRPLILSRP